ncbi:Unknown protein sequence [Pseudomonas syringae pv. spinaceae]|uniref:Uncharacterized protein n=1 Tax=Pseudomonas syringae pv. spinaceae TaxID=264459 RepID=A0A0Q0BCJ6_PSESX|nr:hypothetical protein [Pseudomonas syringae]KPY89754.1 Unknown protein sequence [Pseudomonas syringae pv. spinaceae]
MVYAGWAVVLFFAIGWAFGLIVNPQFRLKTTVVTVMHWWIAIGAALVFGIKVWHLFWVMPLILVASMIIGTAMLARQPPRVMSMFIATAVISWPAIWMALKLSK